MLTTDLMRLAASLHDRLEAAVARREAVNETIKGIKRELESTMRLVRDALGVTGPAGGSGCSPVYVTLDGVVYRVNSYEFEKLELVRAVGEPENASA